VRVAKAMFDLVSRGVLPAAAARLARSGDQLLGAVV
jgi:hypothetical protein